jgi:hypothetical protein
MVGITPTVVVIGQDLNSHSDLAKVLHASSLFGSRPRLRQAGQQQRGKDRNDRDHNEQFDQSEPFCFPHAVD